MYNGECRPFIVDGLQVGVVRPDVLKELFKYPEVFVIKDNEKSKVVELNPAFRDYNERTENVDRVLRQFRKDDIFLALKGWRDEVIYYIYFCFHILLISVSIQNYKKKKKCCFRYCCCIVLRRESWTQGIIENGSIGDMFIWYSKLWC